MQMMENSNVWKIMTPAKVPLMQQREEGRNVEGLGAVRAPNSEVFFSTQKKKAHLYMKQCFFLYVTSCVFYFAFL